MNQKQFLLILSVAVISGFLGGALSVWFLMPPSVLVQDESPKVIEAEGFVLRDTQGRIRAELKLLREQAVLHFYDEEGKIKTVVD